MELIKLYKRTRLQTEELCKDLLIEDYVIQTMEDVSPPKWHLAHTTWFFETFILKPFSHYNNPNPTYAFIFNSYYQGIGEPYPRNQRGLLARPSVQEVYEYRQDVDYHLIHLLEKRSSDSMDEIQSLVELGIHHEQQHQELLLMDVLHNLSFDPCHPAYQRQQNPPASQPTAKQQFLDVEGGIQEIGHFGKGFCYDNELPRHPRIIQPFSIANRLVTNQDYLEFIEDKGYFTPRWWLSNGWDWLHKNQIQAPLYWHSHDHQWMNFTLQGYLPLDLMQPIRHISFYEADAFARWKTCRLATEEEWEYAASTLALKGFDYGELWEWTSSAYLPYPGHHPLPGTIGEYNAKFMNNQRVLRGASFATPREHRRLSYRNFYEPDKRWQFCGMRLVKNGV